jgi:hypothetical protein
MKSIKNKFKNLIIKVGIAKDLFEFLWKRKLWWLMPVVLIILILTAILFFAQATGVSPLIYALF